MIQDFLTDALMLATWATVIPLAVASGCGLLVAVLQAVTQVQESTTVYLAKLGGLSITIILMWGKLGEALHDLMTRFGQMMSSGGGALTW